MRAVIVEVVSAWVLSTLLGFLVLALIIYLMRADAARLARD
jgi:hypothetical protein